MDKFENIHSPSSTEYYRLGQDLMSEILRFNRPGFRLSDMNWSKSLRELIRNNLIVDQGNADQAQGWYAKDALHPFIQIFYNIKNTEKHITICKSHKRIERACLRGEITKKDLENNLVSLGKNFERIKGSFILAYGDIIIKARRKKKNKNKKKSKDLGGYHGNKLHPYNLKVLKYFVKHLMMLVLRGPKHFKKIGMKFEEAAIYNDIASRLGSRIKSRKRLFVASTIKRALLITLEEGQLESSQEQITKIWNEYPAKSLNFTNKFTSWFQKHVTPVQANMKNRNFTYPAFTTKSCIEFPTGKGGKAKFFTQEEVLFPGLSWESLLFEDLTFYTPKEVDKKIDTLRKNIIRTVPVENWHDVDDATYATWNSLLSGCLAKYSKKPIKEGLKQFHIEHFKSKRFQEDYPYVWEVIMEAIVERRAALCMKRCDNWSYDNAGTAPSIKPLALDEGNGKVRIATISGAEESYLGQILTHAVLPVIKKLKPCKAQLEGKQIKLIAHAGEDVSCYSFDLSKATEHISHEVGLTVLKTCIINDPTIPEEHKNKLLRYAEIVVGKHTIVGGKFDGLITVNSLHMGLGISWSITNLLLLFCAQGSSWSTFAAHGDDLFAIWTSDQIARFESNVTFVGLVMNKKKTYKSPDRGIFCQNWVTLKKEVGKYGFIFTATSEPILMISEATGTTIQMKGRYPVNNVAAIRESLQRARKEKQPARVLLQKLQKKFCISNKIHPIDQINEKLFGSYGLRKRTKEQRAMLNALRFRYKPIQKHLFPEAVSVKDDLIGILEYQDQFELLNNPLIKEFQVSRKKHLRHRQKGRLRIVKLLKDDFGVFEDEVRSYCYTAQQKKKGNYLLNVLERRVIKYLGQVTTVVTCKQFCNNMRQTNNTCKKVGATLRAISTFLKRIEENTFIETPTVCRKLIIGTSVEAEMS